MPLTKCFPYRPHDYVYDPLFTVSGPTDHYKAGIIAKMSTAKFQICPIFSNMFSDLPNHPRCQLVERRSPPIQHYRHKKKKACFLLDPALQKKLDVLGADRAKFFCPIVNLPAQGSFPTTIPTFTIEKIDESEVASDGNESIIGANRRTKDVYVETQYRESSAQTIPWEPPYTVIGKGDPEVLKLEFLKWGSGLPAGMHEVRLIERARMKRAWEQEIKPDINDEQSLARFAEFVDALERDEWAFREMEIQEINDLRLHLLEQMLKEVQEASVSQAQAKVMKFAETKMMEKERKLAEIKHKTARELRKLEMAKRGLDRKYKVADIVDEHASKRSELYAPLIRHGEHPKRWHMVINEKMKKYRAQFIGVEELSTLPKWLDQATNISEFIKKPKKDGAELCIRETKWTAPVLKELYEELQNLRKKTANKVCTLRLRIEEKELECMTPEVEGIPQLEEDQYEALVLLQSLIKGRATQSLIYEGRDNCKELILELKNTVGLLKKEKEEKTKDKLKVRLQQREETVQSVMVNRLQGSLGKLQGGVVGTLLDFLNKELRRLLEERKAHAMCWVNERERKVREAAEAGRRQKELRRRREHDEMFKQIVKVTQDSVDLYLQDIITEGMEFSSREEAHQYVMRLSRQLAEEAEMLEHQYMAPGVDEEDEMVADMLHHFVLPEVEKQLIRNRIKVKQKQGLKTVHETVYSKFEHLPKVEVEPEVSIRMSETSIIEVPMTQKEQDAQSTAISTEGHSAMDMVTQILKEIEENVHKQVTADEHRLLNVENAFEDYLNQLTLEADIAEGVYDTRPEHSYETDETFYYEKKELDTITEVETEDTISVGVGDTTGPETTKEDASDSFDFSEMIDLNLNSISVIGLTKIEGDEAHEGEEG